LSSKKTITVLLAAFSRLHWRKVIAKHHRCVTEIPAA